MKKVLVIVFISLFSINGFCETESFSVIAVSGLNMRQQPDLKSQVISLLPFGSVVEAEFNVLNNRSQEIEIDGRKGKWIFVTYKNYKGFVFSGFLSKEVWVVQPKGNVNLNYRILTPGFHCDQLNYSPGFYWYAMKVKGGKTDFIPVEIKLKFKSDYSEKDKIENVDWESYSHKIEVNPEIEDYLIIGFKDELNIGSQTFPNFRRGMLKQVDLSENIFFYPEQFISFPFNRNEYWIGSIEEIFIDSTYSEGFRRKYQLLYKVANRKNSQSIEINLDYFGELGLPAERHAFYQTPSLEWIGDINNDGFIDLLFHSSNMADGCGVCWATHLFVSENNGKITLEKVADLHGCNCFP